MNFAVHTSLITLTFSRGWCDFQLICNYQAPRGGWLNNRPGHRSRRDTVAGHMGSGPRGRECGRMAAFGTAELPVTVVGVGRLNYSETGATALSSGGHIARRRFHPQFLFPISHLDYCQIGYVQPPRFTPRFTIKSAATSQTRV